VPLAIEVAFGTGRYWAADVNDRRNPEWPPHPARLFAAMVEGWARYGSDPPDSRERSALEWLEQQPPPTVWEPGGSSRQAVGLFVPVNNETQPTSRDRRRGVDKWWTLVPDERKRTPRLSVPSTLVGGDGRVVFTWPGADPTAAQRGALGSVLERVTRVGHSSSFVACRLIDDPPEAVWVPQSGSAGSAFSMRAIRAGMLEQLVARHDLYLETGLRNIPMQTRTVFYTAATGTGTGSPHPTIEAGYEWIVFELDRSSRRLSSARTAQVAKALRGALISYCSQTPPKLLVGKDPDGRPTADPHALFLSLPFVGHRYSDGTVKGVAVVFPPDPDAGQRRSVLKAVRAWEMSRLGKPLLLRLGGRGVLGMHRLVGEDATDTGTLDPGLWSRPSRRWGSVTALALPREAYKLTRGSPSDIRRAWRKAEEAVVEAARFAGLPEPLRVYVGFDPPVRGGSHSGDYPVFAQGRKRRLLLHAVVEFDEPVAGPLVLGSGRFRGLGLMLPLDPVPSAAPSRAR